MTQDQETQVALDLARAAYANGTLAIFVGAGFSRLSGLRGWADLYSDLASKIGQTLSPSANSREITQIAQLYEKAYGRKNLVDFLKEKLSGIRYKPTQLHQSLAHLTVDKIYTTNYDTLIEDGFKATNGREYGKVVRPNEFRPEKNITHVIKISGDIEQSEGLLITANDYTDAPNQKKAIFESLKSTLREGTLLVLGYGLDDPFIDNILNESFKDLGSLPCISITSDPNSRDLLTSKSVKVAILEMPKIDGRADYFSFYKNALFEVFGELVACDPPNHISQSTTQDIPVAVVISSDVDPKGDLEQPAEVIDKQIDIDLPETSESQVDGIINSLQEEALHEGRKLMKEGKFEQARIRLGPALNAPGGSDELRQQILFNLGLAHYHLGYLDEALKCFQQGVAASEGTPRAIQFSALILQLNRHYFDALALLDTHPNQNNFDIIQTRACILVQQSGYQHALDYVESLQDNRQEVLLFKAQLLLSLKRCSEVIDLLKSQVDEEEFSRDRKFLLGMAKGALVVEKANKARHPKFLLSQADKQELKEATVLLEDVYATLKSTDKKHDIISTCINLSAFYSLLGDTNKSFLYSDRVLEMEPTQVSALYNKHGALLQLNRFKDALNIAVQILALDQTDFAFRQAIVDATYSQQYETAFTILNDYRNASVELSPWFFVLQARISEACGQIGAAEVAILEGFEKFPYSGMVLLERARLADILGRKDEANQIFLEAISRATKEERFEIRSEYAWFCYQQRNWKDAALYFVPEVGNILFSPHLAIYLVCKYNDEKYSECVAILEQLQVVNAIADLPVLDIASKIYYKLRDLGKALAYLETALRIERTPERCIGVIDIYTRLGQYVRAKQESYDGCVAFPENTEVLLVSAQAYFFSGDAVSAFAWAKRAFRIAPHQLPVLKSLTWYSLNCVEGALSKSDHDIVAKAMMELASNPDSGIKSIHLSDDHAEIFEPLRKREVYVNSLLTLYAERSIPLWLLPELIGSGFVQIWKYIVSDRAERKLRIWMSVGTREIQNLEEQTADRQAVVSVDLSALLTLHMLGMLNLIPLIFREVRVSYSVLEELLLAAKNADKSQSSGTLSSVNGQIIFQENTAHEMEAEVGFLRGIVDFLSSGAISLVGVPSSSLDDPEFESNDDALGRWVNATILDAASTGGSIYSDDSHLRDIAKNEHRTEGFCTQTFLKRALKMGVLSSGAYTKAVLQLVDSNYWFVSDSHETLVLAVKEEGTSKSWAVEQLLDRILSPLVTKGDAAKVLGEGAGHLWLFSGSDRRTQLIRRVASRLRRLSTDEFIEAAAEFVFGVIVGTKLAPSTAFEILDCLQFSGGIDQARLQLLKRILIRGIEGLIESCNEEGDYPRARLYSAALSAEYMVQRMVSHKRVADSAPGAEDSAYS